MVLTINILTINTKGKDTVDTCNEMEQNDKGWRTIEWLRRMKMKGWNEESQENKKYKVNV